MALAKIIFKSVLLVFTIAAGAGIFAAAADKKYQPEVLTALLEKVQSARAAGKKPIVIFDLDETLLNSRIRALRILKDIAFRQDISEGFPSEADQIMRMGYSDIRAWIMDLPEILSRAGIQNPRFTERIENLYADAYLSNKFCALDWVEPGAVQYVKKLSGLGAHIAYLTGRNRPGMSVCTEEALRKNGFPLGASENASLTMKSKRALDDAEFKKKALASIAQLGQVVGGFDNEPANVNALKEAFPDALIVFLDTMHSNRPDQPGNNIPWIKDFQN